MNKNTDIEREALQRQLEHHLEDLCQDISKDIIFINDHINVTRDNFTCMTYVGESLEALHTNITILMEYIVSVRTVEKLIINQSFLK